MTLLFILPELPDSSFLESSILKKKNKTNNRSIEYTNFRGYLSDVLNITVLHFRQ